MRCVADEVMISVQGHKLGVRYMRQGEQGGTLGELEGTKGLQME